MICKNSRQSGFVELSLRGVGLCNGVRPSGHRSAGQAYPRLIGIICHDHKGQEHGAEHADVDPKFLYSFTERIMPVEDGHYSDLRLSVTRGGKFWRIFRPGDQALQVLDMPPTID